MLTMRLTFAPCGRRLRAACVYVLTRSVRADPCLIRGTFPSEQCAFSRRLRASASVTRDRLHPRHLAEIGERRDVARERLVLGGGGDQRSQVGVSARNDEGAPSRTALRPVSFSRLSAGEADPATASARTPSKAKLDVMLAALGSNRTEFEALLAERPGALRVVEGSECDACPAAIWDRGRDELLALYDAAADAERELLAFARRLRKG